MAAEVVLSVMEDSTKTQTLETHGSKDVIIISVVECMVVTALPSTATGDGETLDPRPTLKIPSMILFSKGIVGL